VPSTQQLVAFIRANVGRLALSYLVIIMAMSLGFSVVFYNTSSRELGRQIPPQAIFQQRAFGGPSNTAQADDVADFFEQRIAEGRRALLARLMLLNMIALVAGAGLSYYLAKKTLKPIEENMLAQAQFVSDASHELRTPLTALRTTNEVALRRSKLGVADAKKLLQENLAEVIKLQHLTDSLLKLASQTNQQLELQEIELQPVVIDAVQQIAPAAALKHMSIEDNTDNVKVLGDAKGLQQVLAILLDNAVKYSPEKSVVTVSSRMHSKYVELLVRDNGIGIKAVDIPHIFDRFYRADQSRSGQKVEGYGIGLSLAQKIIQQHGGSIMAQSWPGKGTTIVVRIAIQ
jgi:two-component system, OmpR family, sensor histidine kinase CiaH